MIFKNRIDAGKLLAHELEGADLKDAIILGLPRGGVPVAYGVAKALGLKLDVIIVRKLGVPWQPELAFGAIGEGGEIFLNQGIVSQIGITEQVRKEIELREREEIKERQRRFRGDMQPIDIAGKKVVIVDDGIATGATVQVSCQVAKARGASEIVVAAPVATKEAVEKISQVAHKCYVLETPDDFLAVGDWYEDFSPTSDEDVARLLNESRGRDGS